MQNEKSKMNPIVHFNFWIFTL